MNTNPPLRPPFHVDAAEKARQQQILYKSFPCDPGEGVSRPRPVEGRRMYALDFPRKDEEVGQ
jgi:hypothetical protein